MHLTTNQKSNFDTESSQRGYEVRNCAEQHFSMDALNIFLKDKNNTTLLTQESMPQLITQLNSNDSNDSNNSLFKIIASFTTCSPSSTNVDFQCTNHKCNVGNINFEFMFTTMLLLDYG